MHSTSPDDLPARHSGKFVSPPEHAPPPDAWARRHKELLDKLAHLSPSVIRPANRHIRHPYCIPGGFYDQQWDWDGFFIASHFAGRTPPRAEYLKFWVLNILEANPDGREPPACIKPDGTRINHSSLTLKPFIAQGAELASRLLGDHRWIAPHCDTLTAMATRREATHFLDGLDLYAWDDAMQSGADNNPAVGNDPQFSKRIAACDLNAFLYREYLALARLAGRLGRPGEREAHAAKAKALRRAVNRHLWDEASGSYWNLDSRTHRWCQRVSYSNFVPLWAGMVPSERARRMIRHYLWKESHLLTDHGLRSLSRQDPEYNNGNVIVPYSNWQGPIWPIANYFFFIALMNYGFHREAADLVDRLAALYLRDLDFCGSLHENYDAETGNPLAPSATQSDRALEGGFVGWNLLLIDMIEMIHGRPHLLKLTI